jgi:hypothetical protein
LQGRESQKSVAKTSGNAHRFQLAHLRLQWSETDFSRSPINQSNQYSAAGLLDKDYTITAEVTIPEGGAEGMIVTLGGRISNSATGATYRFVTDQSMS